MKFIAGLISLLVFAGSCSTKEARSADGSDVGKNGFYRGADLSYVNEMEDCGAVYRNAAGVVQDPFNIFSDAGCNLVRVRLWNDPAWTSYSDYDDVKKTIVRAKEAGMQVLLDFHYSDTWADPEKQIIPAAWLEKVDDMNALGNLVYDYTAKVLSDLAADGLLPEMVQVGNEINSMVMRREGEDGTINWTRNAYLLNQGIRAVRDISRTKNTPIAVMLHIAQPENALWWFKEATANGITDFDWIGLSYYPLWSEYSLDKIPVAIRSLIDTYKKRLMVVETAYPFTMENNDDAGNILDEKALIEGYPATQQGQYDYMMALRKAVESGGGEGVIYWEPAWVSSNCYTLWGHGSHWDNATLFDHDGKSVKGMEFYNESKK